MASAERVLHDPPTGVGAAPATAGAAAAAGDATGEGASTRTSTGTKTGEPIVLYDGVCGLCNRVVNFVIPRDPDGRIRFAPLQGVFAAEVLRRHGIPLPEGDPDSFVLVEHPGTPEERLSLRSTAALRTARWLTGPWSWLSMLLVIPRPLRDWVYDRVARSRYRLFGKLDACPMPSPESRARFLA